MAVIVYALVYKPLHALRRWGGAGLGVASGGREMVPDMEKEIRNG